MSQPRTRVLVVDDEPSVLLEISGALKRHYDVVTAQSAEEAESILAKERIDLLLTDLRLPGNDGLHLLESAKTVSPDLPVVIMSGQDNSVGFKVVHGILAAISIGFGVAIGKIGWEARRAAKVQAEPGPAAPPPPQRQPVG